MCAGPFSARIFGMTQEAVHRIEAVLTGSSEEPLEVKLLASWRSSTTSCPEPYLKNKIATSFQYRI
jgi:hypothetical protein